MKILHLNFSSKGGAGIGVARLHDSLKKRNIKSYVLHYDEFINDRKKNFFLRFFTKFNWKIKLIIKKIIIKFFFNGINKETLSLNIFNNLNLKRITKNIDFDLIHLHWIGNEMISIKEISHINKPIVWTMHDMWPFCGGEHFTNNLRNKNNYSSFNRPVNESGLDINKFVWNKKNRYLKNKDINIICPSEWMLKKVKKSSLFKNHKSQILPYIIDTNKWNYNSRLHSKIITPNGKSVILFNATSSVNFRKGFNFLAEAINNHLNHKEYFLLVVGDKPKKFDDIKIEKKYFGIVNSDKIIKNIYYSSDIFVLPSLFESFGQVFTEAGCFGLPSVAFKDTAVSEIIKHKQNGYLADFKSSKDLANGINWANNELKISSDFKKNNRNMIIKNFSYKNRINDYLKFYKKILEK